MRIAYRCVYIFYFDQTYLQGELITKENIKSVRPACGLNTKYYKEILGKRAKHDIEFAVPLKYDMFE